LVGNAGVLIIHSKYFGLVRNTDPNVWPLYFPHVKITVSYDGCM
jgi:hypothetical protein